MGQNNKRSSHLQQPTNNAPSMDTPPCSPSQNRNKACDGEQSLQELSKKLVENQQLMCFACSGMSKESSLIEDNMSVLERNHPPEIIVSILEYFHCSSKDLMVIGQISRNFRFFWIDHYVRTIMTSHHPHRSQCLFGNTVLDAVDLWIAPQFDNIFLHLQFQQYLKSLLYKFMKNWVEVGKKQKLIFRNPKKFVYLGGHNVGKSKLVTRITSDIFREDEEYVDGDVRIEVCKDSSIDIPYTLWDFLGEQEFRISFGSYLNFVDCIVGCFDLSQENSLEDLKQQIIYCLKINNNEWNTNLNKSLLETSKFLLIFGLKRDLERKISKECVRNFLSEIVPCDGIPFGDIRIQYFEVSSKMASDKELIDFLHLYALFSLIQPIINNTNSPSISTIHDCI